MFERSTVPYGKPLILMTANAGGSALLQFTLSIGGEGVS
jgi:hypothetical protein